jgi:hypothetical protein
MNFILPIFRFICPKARLHQFNLFFGKRKHTEIVYEDINDLEMKREG